MIYEQYNEYKNKYYEAQQKYNEILNEKETIFAITQPKSTTYDKERVTGGSPSNSFDDYLVLKEEQQIDQRLEVIKSILEDRAKLLKLKEEELRHSTNIQDRIYTYRYLDKMKIHKICRLAGYSEAQVYRILKTIKNNLKNDLWLK